jgi:hypothetical protein
VNKTFSSNDSPKNNVSQFTGNAPCMDKSITGLTLSILSSFSQEFKIMSKKKRNNYFVSFHIKKIKGRLLKTPAQFQINNL